MTQVLDLKNSRREEENVIAIFFATLDTSLLMPSTAEQQSVVVRQHLASANAAHSDTATLPNDQKDKTRQSNCSFHCNADGQP